MSYYATTLTLVVPESTHTRLLRQTRAAYCISINNSTLFGQRTKPEWKRLRPRSIPNMTSLNLCWQSVYNVSRCSSDGMREAERMAESPHQFTLRYHTHTTSISDAGTPSSRKLRRSASYAKIWPESIANQSQGWVLGITLTTTLSILQ
jgi:hypothetical protein